MENTNPCSNKACDKRQIARIVIAVYIVLSALFIIYVLYQNFKINYMEKSYASGQEATIQQIITQAEDTACQPFSVYTTEKKVQLINIACLQTATEATSTNTNTNQ